MNINDFKPGDRVIVRQMGTRFTGVPQTVVDTDGDYVRVRLDENVAGLSAGLISSWLPVSLHKVDPRVTTLFKTRTHHGGMEIVNDSQYRQLWVQAINGGGVRGAQFNMDAEAVTYLRDALDEWLKGEN